MFLFAIWSECFQKYLQVYILHVLHANQLLSHLICSGLNHGERPQAERSSRRAAAGRAQLLAKTGPTGRMQIPAELVPIPDASRMRPGCVRMRPDASGCVPDASGI